MLGPSLSGDSLATPSPNSKSRAGTKWPRGPRCRKAEAEEGITIYCRMGPAGAGCSLLREA